MSVLEELARLSKDNGEFKVRIDRADASKVPQIILRAFYEDPADPEVGPLSIRPERMKLIRGSIVEQTAHRLVVLFTMPEAEQEGGK